MFNMDSCGDSRSCIPAGDNPATLNDDVSALARVVGSNANLSTMRTLEERIEKVIAWTESARALSNIVELTMQKVKQAPVTVGEYIDPDDESISVFKAAYESFESQLPKLVLYKAHLEQLVSGEDDPRVAFLDETGKYIEAIAACVEGLKDIVAVLIAHDLKAEPREIQDHTSVSELISTLHG